MINLVKKTVAIGLSSIVLMSLVFAVAVVPGAANAETGSSVGVTRLAEATSTGSGGLLNTIKTQNSQFASDSGITNTTDPGDDYLPRVIGRAISIVIGILGIVLVVLFIYSGYLWMTAQGNSGQVDTAKKNMTNATIGLIILASSYAITTFIISQISETVYSSSGSSGEMILDTTSGTSPGTTCYKGVCN